jgi:hypothetical protein
MMAGTDGARRLSHTATDFLPCQLLIDRWKDSTRDNMEIAQLRCF